MTDNSPQLSQPPDQPDPGLGGKRRTLHLVEMLQHEDPDVRAEAAERLAEQGDERAMSVLFGLIDEVDLGYLMRRRAVRALASINRIEVVDKLVTVVETDPVESLAVDAIDSLHRLAPNRLKIVGLRLLEAHHPNERARRGVTALRSLRHDQDIRIVLNGLMCHDDRRDVRAQAIDAYRLEPHADQVDLFMTALEDEFYIARAYAAWALGVLGERRAIPKLLGLLRTIGPRNDFAFSYIVRALAKLQAAEVSPYIREVFARHASGDDSISYGLFEQCLEAVTELGDNELMQFLVDQLAHENDPDFQYSIVRALRNFSIPSACDPLLALLDSLTDEKEFDAIVIDVLLLNLARLKDPTAVPHIEAFLQMIRDNRLDAQGEQEVMALTLAALISLGELQHLDGFIRLIQPIGWNHSRELPHEDYSEIGDLLRESDGAAILVALQDWIRQPDLSDELPCRAMDLSVFLGEEIARTFLSDCGLWFPHLDWYASALRFDAFGPTLDAAVKEA
ncbi:MAG: hypothetical protein GYB68_11150 [Chloroflexi bacterium]|nr:hypothetical protein [Chloroflexota bacterium]